MGKVEVQTTHGKIMMDNYLKKKLDNILMILKENWDAVIIIDGKERSGKSELGFTCGDYLSYNLGASFELENVCAHGKDALEKLESFKDKSVLQIDEGSLMFSSKDALTNEQKQLIKVLNVIGQKNMVLIIVLPSIFDLHKYIAVRRSLFLLHVYADEKGKRGRFCYFGEHGKAELYDKGKKSGSYAYPDADFVGRYDAYNPFGNAYKETKKESLHSTFEKENKTDWKDFYYKKMQKVQKNIEESKLLTEENRAKLLDITRQTLYNWGKAEKEG